MRGKGTKLGEGCPKVRLSQDRMTILSFHLAYSEGKGTKLGEGERDLEGESRKYPENILGLLRSVLLRSGLLRSGQLCSAMRVSCKHDKFKTV